MSIVDVMNLRVVDVEPDVDVVTAARVMIENGVGSVAVCDRTRMVGILTERDILRLVADGQSTNGRPVTEVMTTELVTTSADADVLEVAEVMGKHRIRHLPVLEGENLLGMVGVREVVDVLAERLWRAREPGVRTTVHKVLGTLRSSTAQRG